MIELLRRLIELEADVSYQSRPTGSEPEFRYVPGKVAVLLSAPHGAVQIREGRKKEEDEYTAGLARLIGEITGAHVLYARRRSNTDPNWYPNAPYKAKLRGVVESVGIRFILDLHGVCERRGFGIAIGTMCGKTCPLHLPKIIGVLESHGFSEGEEHVQDRLDLDSRFTGAGVVGQETITRFGWEQLHVPVAQFEIHPSLRVIERREDASQKSAFNGDPERIRRAIAALVEVVGVVSVQTPN
jgi:hypothetical protein